MHGQLSVSYTHLAYQAERQTFFVLESLDHLRKNGRLSAAKAFVASALNIKPVMEGNKPVSYTHLDVYKRQLIKTVRNVGYMIE